MSKSRDIADSAATINYIDNVTSDVQAQIDSIETTLGTLTKSFNIDESYTINLNTSVVAPVVSVTKEVPQSEVTNSDWFVDSNTENYELEDKSFDATLLFDVYEKENLGSATKTFSIQATGQQAYGFCFSSDGRYIADIRDGIDSVRTWILSTPYDISTAQSSSILNIGSYETSPTGVAFNNDGTKVFICGTTSDSVHQFSLSIPYQVATGTHSGSFNVNSTASNPKDLSFNSDGTKMYVISTTLTQIVAYYSLSSAFDVTTASHDGNFIAPYANSKNYPPDSFCFSSDGTHFLTLTTTGIIAHYVLSTAYDLTSATLRNITTVEYRPSLYGIKEGKRGHLVLLSRDSGDDKLIEFNATPNRFRFPIGSPYFVSDDLARIVTANNGKFKLYSGVAGVTNYDLLVEPDNYENIAPSDWTLSGLEYDETDNKLVGSTATVYRYDPAYKSFTQNFSLSSTNGVGFCFSPDGTKMYVTETSSNLIYQYSLSVGYDISTAILEKSQAVNGAITSTVHDIHMEASGRFVTLLDRGGQRIVLVSLSTPFEIDSLSTSVYTSLDISAQETNPESFRYSNDGMYLYFVGTTSDSVWQAYLNRPFYPSAAYVSFLISFSVSAQTNVGPNDVFFNEDGSKMYVLDNSAASDPTFVYDLSTNWNINTATYSGTTINWNTWDTAPEKFQFNQDGTKLYMLGNSADDINEFDIGSLLPKTGDDSAVNKSSIDTTYWTSLDFINAQPETTAAHYAWSTDGRNTWTVNRAATGLRNIVRNNSGTWQYNSNTDDSLETWTNATKNDELSALTEALTIAQNVMGRGYFAEAAGLITIEDTFDIAIILGNADSQGVSLSYNAAALNKGALLGTDYEFDSPAQDKVRIKSLSAQNLKVRVV